jgi:DNA ligase-associated metallophosphoesterase
VRSEIVSLLGSRAAYWARTRTLLVADLHLGKAQAMRSLGVPLPATAMLRRQLSLLESLCVKTQATRMLILGDLLHAPSGITEDVVATFGEFSRRIACRIQVVPGNHDRMLDRLCDPALIDVLPESFREGPFEFTHEPPTQPSDHFVWCGHLHPAVAIRGITAGMKLPCFRLDASRCILPALSAFTGGATFRRAAGERVFAVADQQIIEVTNDSGGLA